MFFFVQAQFFQGVHQPGCIIHFVARIGVCLNSLTNGHARKGLRQIHRLALIVQLQAAFGLHGHVTQQLLGKVHQVAVVPVGGIELHHGEFGVMPHADAFVAEAAVDFKHALETAHDQPLEVQLGRDAQKHVLIQRIVVRNKRLGVGAARNRVQHGRFHFEKAVFSHEVAHTANGFAARHKTLACLLVHHQIHITLAVFQLLILHAMEFVGHGAQALGEHADGRGVNRQLACAGFEQIAFGCNDVAQVPVFEIGIGFFAHIIARDVHLKAPCGVLQGGETGLAHDALEHHASGNVHPNVLAGSNIGFQLLFALAAMRSQ